MANIAIIDIRRTQTSIAFRFKTTFDSNFRRGCGDHLYIPHDYLGLNVVIESVSCPELVGALNHIYVEGANTLCDDTELFLSFDKFLYLNTAIHIFNIGKFEVTYMDDRDTEADEESCNEWDYDDDDNVVEF